MRLHFERSWGKENLFTKPWKFCLFWGNREHCRTSLLRPFQVYTSTISEVCFWWRFMGKCALCCRGKRSSTFGLLLAISQLFSWGAFSGSPPTSTKWQIIMVWSERVIPSRVPRNVSTFIFGRAKTAAQDHCCPLLNKKWQEFRRKLDTLNFIKN